MENWPPPMVHDFDFLVSTKKNSENVDPNGSKQLSTRKYKQGDFSVAVQVKDTRVYKSRDVELETYL